VLFCNDINPSQWSLLGPSIDHRVAENRQARVYDSGVVSITYGDAILSLTRLPQPVAREIGATVVPDLADKLFADDPDMLERLHARHAKIELRASVTAPPPATASVAVTGCRYLGGISQLPGPARLVSLRFDPTEIVMKKLGRTVFRVSEPERGGVGIEGHEQVFTVAVFTGLRLGELRELRWRDIDFGKQTVIVRGSYTHGKSGPPKSG
jgi:hypothetical protein